MHSFFEFHTLNSAQHTSGTYSCKKKRRCVQIVDSLNCLFVFILLLFVNFFSLSFGLKFYLRFLFLFHFSYIYFIFISGIILRFSIYLMLHHHLTHDFGIVVFGLCKHKVNIALRCDCVFLQLTMTMRNGFVCNQFGCGASLLGDFLLYVRK